MLQNYIVNNINHNKYLKIYNKNSYVYDKIDNVKIILQFNQYISNNKLLILSIYFFFKNLLLKNGYFIILNRKNKKILGIKFLLKGNLMYLFLNFLILNFLVQQDIKYEITIKSFDTYGNYILKLPKSSYYYFEKFIINNNFKNILNHLNICIIFCFKNNIKNINNLLDHIFFLNMLNFYFFESKSK